MIPISLLEIAFCKASFNSIRDGDGVAGQILRHFGVDLEQARRELLDVLTPKYQMDADEDNIIPDDDDDEEENNLTRFK